MYLHCELLLPIAVWINEGLTIVVSRLRLIPGEIIVNDAVVQTRLLNQDGTPWSNYYAFERDIEQPGTYIGSIDEVATSHLKSGTEYVYEVVATKGVYTMRRAIHRLALYHGEL